MSQDALLRDLLPGPVTVVFERTEELNPELNPHTRLVGVRVPDHPFIRRLVDLCGEDGALALTSANRSGQSSTVAVEEFREMWGELGLVCDGGRIGSELAGSTVVDLSQAGRYRIIREGSAGPQTRDTLHRHGLIEDSA